MGFEVDSFRETIAKEGVTTEAGAATGDSIIDSSLMGAGANSFKSMLMVVYPCQPTNVDSMDITDFNNATGEVILSSAYKGVAAAIPAGVPYKIVTFRFVTAEVAALAALVVAIKAVTDLLPDGGALSDLAAILEDTGTTLPATLAAIAAAMRGTDNAALAASWTAALATALANYTAVRAGYLDELDFDLQGVLTTIAEYIDTEIGAIKDETDQLPNVQHETEWASTAVVEQVAAAAPTNLTAGSITPAFPTGSTRVRAILIASIHAANQAANTHHIDVKVQGQKAAGGYGDQLDLTAQDSLGLVNLDGAADGLCVAVDVTTLVDASGAVYDFRFVVNSDNAGAVNYTTSFVLVLVYTM